MNDGIVLEPFFTHSGDGSHPVYGHAAKHEHHVESVAAPGEPNLGY